MPREFNSDNGFEVKREFAVRRSLQLGDANGGNSYRWWVSCYRDHRLSGSTPYDYERAVACVQRLLGDGWVLKPGDRDTIEFLAGALLPALGQLPRQTRQPEE